jgi:hypothetical protein
MRGAAGGRSLRSSQTKECRAAGNRDLPCRVSVRATFARWHNHPLESRARAVQDQSGPQTPIAHARALCLDVLPDRGRKAQRDEGWRIVIEQQIRTDNAQLSPAVLTRPVDTDRGSNNLAALSRNNRGSRRDCPKTFLVTAPQMLESARLQCSARLPINRCL